MNNKTKPLYEFGRFRISAEDRLLFKENEVVPLAPKVFDILLTMVEKSGRVLDKDELIQQVWADTFVEEGNLARNVSTLRKALGESDEGRPYIETIPRRGYRFVAPVREVYDNTFLVRESSRITIEEEEIVSDGKGEEAEIGGQQGSLAGVQTPTGLLSDATGPAPATVVEVHARPQTRVKWLWALAAVAMFVALMGTFFIGRMSGKPLIPTFHQLTFRRGNISNARFAPDGQTIIYSASFDKKPDELFTTRPESPESRPLGLPETLVLAISKAGEMAVQLKPQGVFLTRGTLARLPLAGGAPREVLDDVQEADFSPDGKELAVIHWQGSAARIEYPIGTVLYEAKAPEWLSNIRISPKGDQIAFLDYPAARFDDRGYVAVLDLQGNKKILSREYTSANGLAWSSTGDEIFITASTGSLNNELRAISLTGKERLMSGAAGRLKLLDVSSDNRALTLREDGREGIISLPPGETKERELSWLDFSWLRDISVDGKTILFDEEGAGGGDTASVYIRKTDGSPAVRLGEGHAMALSPDGKWALAHLRFAKPRQIVLYPTGAGEKRVLVSDASNYLEFGSWFPDGKHLLLRMREEGHEARSYVFDIDSGQSLAILQEGVVGRLISPDGKFVIAGSRQRKRAAYAIETSEPRTLTGLEDPDSILNWSVDGKALFVGQGTNPVKIYRLDYQTGKRQLIHEINYPITAGIFSINAILIPPDGKSYSYTYTNIVSELFLADGLK